MFRLNCGLLSTRDESPEGAGFLASVMASAVVGDVARAQGLAGAILNTGHFLG